MARGPQQGDRYGDWYLESRAKPVEGKRFWNAVNTVTDEKAVVPQTQLKALGEGKFFPSDGSFINALEADVPSSAEITAKVLLANYADDPFSIPDGILPDFEVEFIEPCPLPDGCDPDVDHDHDPFAEYEGLIDDRETYEDDYEPGAEDNDNLDGLAEWAAKQDLGLDDDDCVACARCKVVDGEHIMIGSTDSGKPYMTDHLDKRDPLSIEINAASRNVASQLGQWEPPANKELLRVAELCEQLSDAICDLVEARL